ncbi:monosaccharide ABC transporter membrane protein, CUT2 family [Sporobacter termitidis DSM 10068]|uniref:Monosaccharide ABC transporter membrane protein, CUT2 family n=1 Tax=Sporobacter termitidis DSM 10068 TaxID=1123282 RepID=A0A1M5VCD2_9FIRM|nr:ABC transporter permease [Sporobacter termitidis]SHH72887.1 monosaccharide ABC transporter membrane protein, CUT2 family [Sporobacter termitidis DSM 10068]
MELKSKEKTMAEVKSDGGVQRMSLRAFLMRYNAIIILVILCIIASVLSPLFVSKTNIFTLLRQQVPYLIIAMGMLMVIITGGIDLSVCSVAAVSSIMVAYSMMKWGLSSGGWDTWAAIAIGVGVGALFGALNGFLIARLRMPAFIVTLAMMYAGEGIAYIITKGNTLMLDNKSGGYADLVGFSTGTTVLGIPYAVIFALVIVIIFYFVMRYTTFGRMVYAIGSNESAVQLAGISSKKHLFFVYLLSGILCGVAGVIITARSGNASALTAGVDYNMSTIAGVVIGGASLMGGEGTVVMTVIGVFIIAVIGNIMNLINLASYPQMVVKAAVIILAVLLKSLSSRKHA